jgi:ribosome-binding ATPase YchF (GTP1/OBG family)
MKIGFTGTDLPEGKIKFRDENLIALEMKDKPKKVSPFFAEFIRDEFIQSDAIVIPKDKILDLLIMDMEKIETRLARLTANDEKALMEKCMDYLEEEIPLCEVEFSDEETGMLKTTAPHSLKPVVTIEGSEDVNTIISLALEKANYMFFYTSGPTESHAWLVRKGSDIVACAAKIHTDLARGFIKGDVVSFEDYMDCHNFNECKSKGLAKLTDRDYTVQPGEIIEIRFNV